MLVVPSLSPVDFAVAARPFKRGTIAVLQWESKVIDSSSLPALMFCITRGDRHGPKVTRSCPGDRRLNMRRSSTGERHYPMRVRTSEMNCRSYFSSKHFWSILVVVKMGDRAVPPFLVQIDILKLVSSIH